jgi:hypothetical protein
MQIQEMGFEDYQAKIALIKNVINLFIFRMDKYHNQSNGFLMLEVMLLNTSIC